MNLLHADPPPYTGNSKEDYDAWVKAYATANPDVTKKKLTLAGLPKPVRLGLAYGGTAYFAYKTKDNILWAIPAIALLIGVNVAREWS